MSGRWLDKKRNVYILALFAIFVESFSAVSMKVAGRYNMLSIEWLFFYGLAVFVLMMYSVMWQLLLEKLPLSTAYLRKGITYILVFIWAFVFFGEKISPGQLLGAAIIIIGMVVSQIGED